MGSLQERPVYVNRREFANYLGAAEFLTRRLSEPHTVLRPFVPRVAGSLIVENDVEKLRLIGGNTVGITERSVGGMETGVSVSTASFQDIDVIAHVFPWEDRLLDRGLAWVSVGTEVPPLFHVTINREHGIEDPEEIAARLELAEQSTIELIEDVLRSEVTPRFAKAPEA